MPDRGAEAESVPIDRIEGTQSSDAQGCHDRSVNQGKLGFQMGVTIGDLALARGPIAIAGVAWIAEDDVGDENLVATQTGRNQKPLEVLSGSIGGKGHAAAVAAEPARCFGNEEHPRADRPISHAE